MLSQGKSMVWVWNWNYSEWTLKAIKRQKSSSRIRAELFWDNLATSPAGLLRLFLLHLLQTKRAQSWRTSSSCHFSLSDIMEGWTGWSVSAPQPPPFTWLCPPPPNTPPPPSFSPPVLLVPPLAGRTLSPGWSGSCWDRSAADNGWIDGWMDPLPSNPSLSPLTLPPACTGSPLYMLLYCKGLNAKYITSKVRPFLQSGAVLAGPHYFKGFSFQTLFWDLCQREAP